MIFFPGHDFYCLINLDDCLYFLIACHFFILVVHHFFLQGYMIKFIETHFFYPSTFSLPIKQK